MTFGEIFRQARRDKKLSQIALATQIYEKLGRNGGNSNKYISLIERDFVGVNSNSKVLQMGYDILGIQPPGPLQTEHLSQPYKDVNFRNVLVRLCENEVVSYEDIRRVIQMADEISHGLEGKKIPPQAFEAILAENVQTTKKP